MAFSRDTSASIRENILAFLKDAFESKTEGTDGYTVTWHTVSRSPIGDLAQDFDNAIAILDSRERKTPEIGYQRCVLPIVIEFAYRPKLGDVPSTELNRLLVDVERTLREDIYADNLALNLEVTGSELDMEGPNDKLVRGALFVDVTYRHEVNDPRKLPGE